MGTSKNYDLGTKTLKKFEYNKLGSINGISIIKSDANISNGLPRHSVTSKCYIIYDRDKKKITQVGFYNEKNELYKRMDWGHNHKQFKEGTPHIQYFDEKNTTREPNEEELKLFNAIKEKNFYDKKY